MAHALIVAAQWVGSYIAGTAAAAGATAGTVAAIQAGATAVALVAEVAALSAVSTAMTPKVGGDFGTQVDFKADARGPIPYAMGRTGTGGNVVFQQTAGSKNIYNSYVTVYTAAGPIDSYESFLVNGVAVTFGTDSGEGASGFYQNRMWRKTQLGATPESGYLHWTNSGTKDTPGDHGGLPAEWTSAHKLSGYAADLWTLQYNTTIYSGGVPKRLTVGKWVKVYDPRKDSTYPGGSGSHRALNEATYEWSENPYLHALTWCLGRFDNGVHTLGLGAPAAMIDIAAFVEGANVADANGWTMGGVAYSTDDRWEVLKGMLQAGGGKPMRLGSKISCLISTPRTSLATLTGADVVGEASITGTPSRRTRINTIWPKYREEAQGWEIVTADDPITVSAHVTEDGGKVRSREVEYSFVQNSDQAAQLARYDIENSREFSPVTLPCKPRWMGYKPGDCITVNEPEYGLNTQKMLILKRRRDPVTMVTTLTLMSETDAKHGYALGETLSPPATPGLTSYDPNQSVYPATGSWTATGTSLTAADGSQTPAIVFLGEVTDPNVTALIAEWRLVINLGLGQYGDWMSSEHSAQVKRVEARSLLASTQYHCRVRYRTIKGAEADSGLDLGLVTTGATVASSVVTIGGRTPGELVADLAYVVEQGRLLTQAGLETFGRLQEDRVALYQATLIDGQHVKTVVLNEITARQTADTAFVNQLNLIGAVSLDGASFILSDSTVMATSSQTWGQYKTAVTAAFAANSTAISNEVTARASADSALASSLSSLTTTVGSNTASITTLQTSVNGLDAQYVLAVDVNGKVSGLKLASSSTVSSIAFVADQIGFANSAGSTIYPLTISGGVVRATNFEADQVKANTITATEIVSNSIVESHRYALGSTVSVTSGAETSIMSQSVTTSGGFIDLDIFINCNGNVAGGTSMGVIHRLYRDGTLILPFGHYMLAGKQFNSTTFTYREQPSAGSHTYEVTSQRDNGSGFFDVDQLALTVRDNKTQA